MPRPRVPLHGPEETRKVIRFPLEARVVFWWVESGITKRGEGRTRDISERGAFVLASACPAPGIHTGLKIFLPPLPGSEQKTTLEAEGQVLRVEQQPQGFAILAQHITLRFNTRIHEQGEYGGDR